MLGHMDITKSFDAQLKLIDQEEAQILENLNKTIADKSQLSSNSTDLNAVLQSINCLQEKSDEMVSTINSISGFSDSINKKIRLLDLARTNIDDAEGRVTDLIDLRVCARGAKDAIMKEDYNACAKYIHRYLTMNHSALRDGTGEVDKIDSNIIKCLQSLEDARTELLAIIKHKFNQAIKSADLAAIEGLFKIYPLLNLHDEGIQDYCQTLCDKLEATSKQNLQIALKTAKSDQRYQIIFADTLTLLLESVARIVDVQQPIIQTYYGPVYVLSMIRILQKQCDRHVRQVITEFVQYRKLHGKLSTINQNPHRSGNSAATVTERLDPKDFDILIGELTLMTTRIWLYENFVRTKIAKDLEETNKESEKPVDFTVQIESIINTSQLCVIKHELLEYYLQLDQYYMEQSLAKAIVMDTSHQSEAQTSSMVDDTFFIVKKCIKRATKTSNIDICCAVINTGCRMLENNYCGELKKHVQQCFQSYPSFIDFSAQAYNPLQMYNSSSATVFENSVGLSSDSGVDSVRKDNSCNAFVIAMNNADVSIEYLDKLCLFALAEVKHAISQLRPIDYMKVESCLSGFVAVADNLRSVVEYGIQQLQTFIVKPKINSFFDGFLDMSYNISENELSTYNASTSFAQNLVVKLDGLLTTFKNILTQGNQERFFQSVTAEIVKHFEKVILKTTYNKLGGFVLDREVRILTGYLTSSTTWTVRDKFARLTQIVEILNLDKVSELSEYVGNHESAVTLKLSISEVNNIIALRSDFKADDIRRMRLTVTRKPK